MYSGYFKKHDKANEANQLLKKLMFDYKEIKVMGWSMYIKIVQKIFVETFSIMLSAISAFL